MPPIIRYLIIGVLLIAAAVIAFYVFIALLLIGVLAWGYLAIRRMFTASASDEAYNNEDSLAAKEHVTVIEGQFETLEEHPLSQEASADPPSQR